MEYFIVLILVFIFLGKSREIVQPIYMENKRSVYLSKIAIAMTFVLLTLLSGLRYGVGTDYYSYRNMFYMLPNEGLFESNIEMGFSFLCKILAIMTTNYIWLFITVAMIVNYFLFKIVLENTYYYELSIFLFISFGFFTSTFNVMRQWLACIIVLYMFLTIQKRNNLKNILFVLLGSLFHKTAIFMIPWYFFVKNNKKEAVRIVLMIAATVLSFKPILVMNIISNIVNKFQFLEKYKAYIVDYSIDNGSSFIFPIICLLVYFLYRIYKKKIIEKRFDIYINILTLAYCFSCIGQKLMNFNRMQMFFLPVLIVCIPEIIVKMEKKEQRFCYWMCIVLGIVFFMNTLRVNGGNIYPYNNILFEFIKGGKI